ncbi:DUF2975 domain-containing protein [Amycolatopsis taiwanensis]|uniref:DUF2975 domain-containing protein n=1 Tax=Amycolatopsis taiwanensis TaxID=342230 RepID=A0A9W6VC83_9PSEU|nr:DUF2975 domain-containing protein [Amycolatopsis taiwanensis]GLY65858.1 hypothetical protein Atai01_24770 [Amycolatopsis taiwanensis]
MRAPKARNPLEPLRSVSGALATLMVIGLAVGVLSAVFGSGSLFGLGKGFLCVNASNVGMSVDAQFAKPGVGANADGVSLCTQHPDAGQQALHALIEVPGGLLFLGALFLLHRVIREAERAGVFGEGVADRLRTLGWFLVAGQLVAMVVKGIATAYLVADLSTLDPATPLGMVYWQWSWPVLLSGLGALTFARIMRIGVRMREDLDGTV